MHFRSLPTVGALLTLYATLADAALSASSTILIFARDEAAATSGSYGLRGYGIPYEVVLVPVEGIELPELTISETEGKYGGFIILSEVGYDYEDHWRSALTDEQWKALYDYQELFSVRMVRLDSFPSAEFGKWT